MNSFDAIIEHCPAIGQWVRVDQTCDECARQHRCPQNRICPIGACFAQRVAAQVQQQAQAAR